MAQPIADDKRLCPTRTSGANALIEQWISPQACLERQRRLYHKCYACQYRGLGAEARLAPAPRPAPAKAEPRAAKKPAAPKKISKAV